MSSVEALFRWRGADAYRLSHARVSERDGWALAVLTKFPGIGRRTAQRLAFHILSTPPEEALDLARAIEEVKSRVRFCRDCAV